MSDSQPMVRIVSDHRERRGALFRALRMRDDVILDVANLKTGDFVVEGRITVERKTCTDLLLSLGSGRLFRQVAALKRRAERPILLVEGVRLEEVSSRLAPSLRGAVTSLSVMWYLPVLWAFDADEAADLLRTIGRQWIRDRRETWAPPPGPPRRGADPRLRLLRCLPGVGPRRARRLIDEFGSIRAICNAVPLDLAGVRGIGPLRAKSVHSFLTDSDPPT